MSILLEITQLENGDVVLREAEEERGFKDSQLALHARVGQAREPLVRIRFSEEVKDMLGSELVGVAEAMIDAATDFLGNDAELGGDSVVADDGIASDPVIH